MQDTQDSTRDSNISELMNSLDRRLTSVVDQELAAKVFIKAFSSMLELAESKWMNATPPSGLSDYARQRWLERAKSLLPTISTLEDIRKLRVALHNKSASVLVAICPNGHETIIARLDKEGTVPVVTGARKRRFTKEDVARMLNGEVKSIKCPQCGMDAQIVAMPEDPITRTVGDVMGSMEELIEDRLGRMIVNHPVYAWVSHVYGLGPALSARLIAIIDAAAARGLTKTAQVWKLANLHVVHVCFNCGLLVMDPLSTNFTCPKCGKPTIGFAPTKYNMTVLGTKLPRTVALYRHGSIVEMEKGDALKAIAGNPQFRASMRLIVNQFMLRVSKSPSVYTVILLKKMLDYAPKVKPIVDRSRARTQSTKGTGIVFTKVWPLVARMLSDHAWTVYSIARGTWSGPMPLYTQHNHEWIPPLVDDPPSKVLKNELMNKVVKRIEDVTKIDVVKVWEYWQRERDKSLIYYNDLLEKLSK